MHVAVIFSTLKHLISCSSDPRLLCSVQTIGADTHDILSCRVFAGTQYATCLGRCSMEEGLLMTMTKDCLTPMPR